MSAVAARIIKTAEAFGRWGAGGARVERGWSAAEPRAETAHDPDSFATVSSVFIAMCDSRKRGPVLVLGDPGQDRIFQPDAGPRLSWDPGEVSLLDFGFGSN